MSDIIHARTRCLGYGIMAGFLATSALSALLLLKDATGLAPRLDPIGLLSMIMREPEARAVGWFAHFLIGTIVWGPLYACIAQGLVGGSHWARGAVFGMSVWLVMMLVLVAMAGAGFFATEPGIAASLVMLVLYTVFGVVLGASYGGLVSVPVTELAHAGSKPTEIDRLDRWRVVCERRRQS